MKKDDGETFDGDVDAVVARECVSVLIREPRFSCCREWKSLVSWRVLEQCQKVTGRTSWPGMKTFSRWM